MEMILVAIDVNRALRATVIVDLNAAIYLGETLLRVEAQPNLVRGVDRRALGRALLQEPPAPAPHGGIEP